MSGACGRPGAQRLGRAPAGAARCERRFPRREPPPPPRVRVPRRRSRAEDGAPPPAVPARRCGREGVGPCLRLPVAAGRRPRASRAAGAGRAFVRSGPALPGQRPDPSSPRGTEPVPLPYPVPAAASRWWFPGKGQHWLGKFRAASREGGRGRASGGRRCLPREAGAGGTGMGRKGMRQCRNLSTQGLDLHISAEGEHRERGMCSLNNGMVAVQRLVFDPSKLALNLYSWLLTCIGMEVGM